MGKESRQTEKQAWSWQHLDSEGAAECWWLNFFLTGDIKMIYGVITICPWMEREH